MFVRCGSIAAPYAAPSVVARASVHARTGRVVRAHGVARSSERAAAARAPAATAHPKGSKRGSLAAVARAMAGNVSPDGYSVDGMGCAAVDEQLLEHEGHLKYRWDKFMETKKRIEDAEGSLEEFAKGYDKFGFNKKSDGSIVYREWAPAACSAFLIGDFNQWSPESHPMQKDDFGVWEITLPAGTIPHGSRVKIKMRKSDQGWVDRIPAWITYATQEPQLGAHYDGVYWDPPAGEKYERVNPRPKRPASSRIYEAHVGMSGEDPKVNTYREFADDILPRIKLGGYNTVQLMAVMEHAYYGSFGYHVTNPFAVSSRCGTPEDLKYLVDKAHGMGIRCLLDVVHCHVSCNIEDGIAGYDFGQHTESSYFGAGDDGYHWLWDSRIYNYGNWEVQRYLLSNLRYWVDEYGFDGFRFDGVTSMLYNHHGLEMEFSGDYKQYFGMETNVSAVNYLMMANDMLHECYPGIEIIAEDVSGMPTLCRPVKEGGIGFDARLAMAIPDLWVRTLKASRETGLKDEDWSMHDIIATLCNRRYTEKCIGYSESHDQSIVGDKTVAFWLMDAEMYDGMSTFEEPTDVVSRGMALHKMIRMITMAIGGEGYLNFMGNEFGHPEWVDFPREGNKWKHDHCRRQWSLSDTEHLRYFELNNFDKALMQLEEKFGFMSHEHQFVSMACEERKVIVAERGPLLFVFNFHPTMSYEGLEVGLGMPGKYRICLDTDAWSFGGAGRVGHDEDHFTSPGGPNTFVGPYEQEPRPCMLKVLSPSRSAQVFYKVPEDEIDMSLNVGAGENVHNLRQPGGLRVEPIGSVPPPRSNAPPPPPPPPPPASNAVGMQRSSVAVDPDQYDPENASRGMARSAQQPAAQTSFNHPATPVGAATYVAKKQLMDDPDQYDPENASRGMARSAQQPAAQTSFGHPAATYVAKKQLMDDPDQFDPENASRGKSRSAAAPSSYGAGGSSAAPSSFGGYGKAAAPSRVTRASDGVVYDPDQYDPNP